MLNKVIYRLSYFLNQTPWDMSEIPQQLKSMVADIQPANALDLGCGTGTHSIYLAKRGWQVTGIDYVSRAIREAKQKMKLADVQVDFRVGDLMKLQQMRLPRIQLALDIKCFHAMPQDHRLGYVAGLHAVMDENGRVIVETVDPRSDMGFKLGVTEAELREAFEPAFVIDQKIPDDYSTWYLMYKNSTH